MATKINVAKSALANLLDLINATNVSANLSTSSVDIGVPSARTPDANPNNTTVSVSPKSGSGIPGDPISVTYMRLALSTGLSGGASGSALNFNVDGNDSTAEAALLAAAATQLGLVAGEFAIDASTPLSGVEQGAAASGILLTPNAGSLLYTGGVTIQVTWPASDLNTLVANKQLDGFEAA
jgi:hypothetical protein